MCFGSCVYIAGVVLDSTHDDTDFVLSPSIKKGWCCRHQTDRWHIVLRFESSSVQGIRQKRLDEFLLHCRTPWGKVASLSILLLTGRINCDATFPHKAVWNSLQGVKWNEIWCVGHYEAWRPRPAQKVKWWLCSRGYWSWERPACGNGFALSLHPLSVRYIRQRIFRLRCDTSKLLLWKLWLS